MILLSAFLFLFVLLSSNFVVASPYAENDAIYYLIVANAAYCGAGSVMTWNCSGCDDTDFTPYGTFYATSTTTFGYIGYSEFKQEITLSFRGTEVTDIKDWINNIDFPLITPWPNDTRITSVGAEVHQGFFHDWTEIREAALGFLTELVQKFPDYPLRVTGHSLGAALAVICGADLKLNVYPDKIVNAYTFGEPRVGNPAFAKLYENLLNETWRVIHYADIVPHLPPKEMGYWHSPYEVWYNTNSTVFKICNDSGEDPSCSDSLLFADSIHDHLTYLNRSQGSCDGTPVPYNESFEVPPQWVVPLMLEHIDYNTPIIAPQ